MPLYAILHTDIEGLHAHSCTLVTAASRIEIVQQMIADPNRWQPLLVQLYPDDDDPRNVWQRIQTDSWSPETVLAWIDQSYCTDAAEMLRIQSVELQSLEHVRMQTRWISAQASNCGCDASTRVRTRSFEPVNPATAHAPETVEALMAAYTALRQQKGRALSAQLVHLQQQVISELQSVRQQEVEFTAEQTQLLEHLRPHFMIDARSVLATPDFERFVHSIFAPTESGVISLPLQVTRHPSDWTITTLPHPLQLQNIQTIQRSQDPEALAFVVRMDASIGNWSQLIAVPVEKQQAGTLAAYEAAYTTRQWIEISVQLQQNLPQLPIDPHLRLRLGQELVCLLAYIGELFNTAGIVDRLANLQF